MDNIQLFCDIQLSCHSLFLVDKLDNVCFDNAPSLVQVYVCTSLLIVLTIEKYFERGRGISVT